MQVNYTTQQAQAQAQAKLRYEPPVLRKHDKLVDIANTPTDTNLDQGGKIEVPHPVAIKDR